MKEKTFHEIIFCFIVLMILCMLGSMYVMFAPVKVIEINGPITVNKEVYQVGDTLEYSFNYCKYKNVIARGSHTLVNHIVIFYAEQSSNVPVGCHNFVGYLPLVDYAPDGEYYLQINLRYELNKLRTVEYTFNTENFKIKK